MHKERDHTRELWLAAVYGLIPEFILSFILAEVFMPGWVGFLAAFFGLQLLYAAIGLRRLLWGWVYFQIRGKRVATQAVIDSLEEGELPRPDVNDFSAERYLLNVIGSENASLDQKLICSMLYTLLNYPASRGKFLETILVGQAFDEAIQQYRESYVAEGN